MMKLSKITTSIGPTSESAEVLEALHNAGTNMYRMNFSHDTHEAQAAKFVKIQAMSKKLDRPMATLADMQGPKHRIGDFKNGADGKEQKFMLEVGQKFILDSSEEPGDNTRVRLPDRDVMHSLKVGDRVLVNDGKMELKITKKLGDDAVETEVVRGNEIWNRRAFNIPDTEIESSILTEKDRKDLDFALTLNPDYVAISFVQKVEDVHEAREYIKARTDRPVKIVAKLERPQVVGERLEEIIDATDVVMIARGDLAVEMPFELVPAAQRRMIRMARAKNKPVIVATQMLGSMEKSLFPTRAEVSDIAVAGYLMADSTMTSEETTMGIYPAETTNAMARILKATEDDMYTNDLDESDGDMLNEENSQFDAVIGMAESEGVVAIISIDHDGDQTRKLSCRKSYLPIVSVSEEQIIANQLCICRGVFPITGTSVKDALRRDDVVKSGDKVMVVSNDGNSIEILTL